MQGEQTKQTENLGAKLERIAQHVARTQGMPVEFRIPHVKQILADYDDPRFVENHAALVVDQSLYAIKLLPDHHRPPLVEALRTSDAMERTQQAAVNRPTGTIQRHARIGLETVKALPRDQQPNELETLMASPFVTEAPDSVGYALDIVAELPPARQAALLNDILEGGQLDKLAAKRPQDYAVQAARLASMLTPDDARAQGIILSPIPQGLTGEYGLNATFAQTALEAGHENMVKPQQLHILTMPASLPPILITEAPRDALAMETVMADYAHETTARLGIAKHMRALSQDNSLSPAQRRIILETSEVIRGQVPEAEGPRNPAPAAVYQPALA